jgi:hypothetical protein
VVSGQSGPGSQPGPAKARAEGQRAGASLGAGGHAGVRDSEVELGGADMPRHAVAMRIDGGIRWDGRRHGLGVRDLYTIAYLQLPANGRIFE